MVASLCRQFVSSVPRVSLDLSSYRAKAKESFQKAFDLLQQTALISLPNVLALGYDVYTGNQFFSKSSANLACGVAAIAAYALAPQLKKVPAKLLVHLPDGLFLAARTRNPAFVRECIQQGTDVNQRSASGALLLQSMIRLGYDEMAELCVQEGADVKALDVWGDTPLNLAVSLRNEKIARLLIQRGANPFEEFNKTCAFQKAWDQNDVRMLRILTCTEGIKAFDECRDRHEFCAVLWPRVPEKIPRREWHKLVGEVKSCPKLEQFINYAKSAPPSRSLREYFLGLDSDYKARLKAKDPHLKKRSTENLLRLLLKRSPLFKKAWELVNKHTKITIIQLPYEGLKLGGDKPIHAQNEGACYFHDTHTIRLTPTKTYQQTIFFLVFETMNALQRISFKKANSKINETSRELHALLLERIELNSARWAERILEANPNASAEPFCDYWKRMNVPFEKGLGSHADHYRHGWDRRVGIQSLIDNPDWLKKRLRELH
jgi:hypothetical protein